MAFYKLMSGILCFYDNSIILLWRLLVGTLTWLRVAVNVSIGFISLHVHYLPLKEAASTCFWVFRLHLSFMNPAWEFSESSNSRRRTKPSNTDLYSQLSNLVCSSSCSSVAQYDSNN